jgi:hypothetical protein
MPQGRWAGIEFPYVEGLRMDEAMNPLTLLCVGMYGESLPNQDGAPMRMVIPWKYGFKSIKSLVKIKFQQKMPPTTWNLAAPNETAPIDKVVTEQHPVGAGVSADVGLVWAAVRKAVVRVSLAPTFSSLVPRVNVAECLLFAAPQVWLLNLESRIVPILVECYSASDSHDIYEEFFALPCLRPGSDNPVVDLCNAPDPRLASRKSADSKERVGSESIVSGDNIRV